MHTSTVDAELEQMKGKEGQQEVEVQAFSALGDYGKR